MDSKQPDNNNNNNNNNNINNNDNNNNDILAPHNNSDVDWISDLSNEQEIDQNQSENLD